MLAVRDVDLFYGAAQALRRVSILAEPGKITCILGRNGVGKTSLLRAIVGLQPIAAGSVSWLDREIAALPPHERARRGIGYVPQGREIFPLLTVRENLETGFAAAPRQTKGIPGEVFELFPVLKDMLRRRGGDLSGGQQQQLAIGRALVMRPRLLVLDEPTEGIQPSIIKEIGRAIAYLRDRGGMAILLVEQYFEFARDLADRFAVMDRGEIVIAGERSEMDETTVRRHLTVQAMHLTPREKDKLLIAMAATVARRRLERGVKLNHPEAVALISDFVVEGARDGRSVADLMQSAAHVVTRAQVMEGIAEMIHDVQVEATFPDGTKLVTVHKPIR